MADASDLEARDISTTRLLIRTWVPLGNWLLRQCPFRPSLEIFIPSQTVMSLMNRHDHCFLLFGVRRGPFFLTALPPRIEILMSILEAIVQPFLGNRSNL
jgi:hypothetical protein